jgi:hypothetical protein
MEKVMSSVINGVMDFGGHDYREKRRKGCDIRARRATRRGLAARTA